MRFRLTDRLGARTATPNLAGQAAFSSGARSAKTTTPFSSPLRPPCSTRSNSAELRKVTGVLKAFSAALGG